MRRWKVHALVLCLIGALALPTSAHAATSVRGPASTASVAGGSTSLAVAAPSAAQPGDLLLASVGFGRGSGSAPALTAPRGWTLVNRINGGVGGSALAIYRHVFAAGESAYMWTSSVAIGGTVEVAAFAGVDPVNPVDRTGSKETKTKAAIPTPALTTTTAGDMLVASFGGYRAKGGTTGWTSPTGMTELADVTASTRSGSMHAVAQAKAGATGTKTATASVAQDDGLANLTALRPSAAVTTTAPTISAVQTGSVTTGAATVTWTTDQAADSQVDYGTTSSYSVSSPLDATLTTSHSVTISGLQAATLYHFRVDSRNAAGQLARGSDFTLQTAALGAVPLIVDTDMFSDTDDAGALATAFGLQLKGEANMIAVGVNTRTSRPAVATNSWRCVAAITAFYGYSSIPIGTAMPNDGTDVNSPDWTGPCAALAPATTPAPDTAVNVFRRALASQPDGSVVFASIGYFGNLAALLASPPDAISPLSGSDLVARKVRTLVAMAGGYPTRDGETNLIGDPASAESVAANWPTKIVWSGYEVGDPVHTGQTLSSVHPATSPIRVAYEAFLGPNHWNFSYDLTAVYHAIRPLDRLLTEVGPGTNVVSDTGGNTFTLGPGNQYYLSLTSATDLDASLEALLDTLPPAPPPPPPSGPNDNFDANSIDPTRWTTLSNGSSVAAANQELEITHPAGAWTSGGLESTPFDATGHTVQLQLVRPANDGHSGSTYGETAVFLRADATHYIYFFVAGGALTAWLNTGSGEVNLTPSWPAYNPTAMRWLRFRESGGTLFMEYAASSSGPWTTLYSMADPFPLSLVALRMTAGANVTTTDVAKFDDVSTSGAGGETGSRLATASSTSCGPRGRRTSTPGSRRCSSRERKRLTRCLPHRQLRHHAGRERTSKRTRSIRFVGRRCAVERLDRRGSRAASAGPG